MVLKIKLKIKPETQNGTKVRVRGKGYDRGDGTFGDLNDYLQREVANRVERKAERICSVKMKDASNF